MTLFPLLPAHAHSLLPLITALAAHHGEDTTATADDLARDLEDGIAWGFGLGDPIAGYALCSLRPKTHRGPRDASLDNIYVVPDRRRKGLARMLSQAVEAEAASRGCDRVVIGAHLGNDAARDAYKAMGYAVNLPQYRRFTKALAR